MTHLSDINLYKLHDIVNTFYGRLTVALLFYFMSELFFGNFLP